MTKTSWGQPSLSPIFKLCHSLKISKCQPVFKSKVTTSLTRLGWDVRLTDKNANYTSLRHQRKVDVTRSSVDLMHLHWMSRSDSWRRIFLSNLTRSKINQKLAMLSENEDKSLGCIQLWQKASHERQYTSKWWWNSRKGLERSMKRAV